MEEIKLSRESFDKLMEILGFKVLKCSYCKDRITKNNFGFIGKDNYSCDSEFCLIQAFDKIEKMKEKCCICGDTLINKIKIEIVNFNYKDESFNRYLCKEHTKEFKEHIGWIL